VWELYSKPNQTEKKKELENESNPTHTDRTKECEVSLQPFLFLSPTTIPLSQPYNI